MMRYLLVFGICAFWVFDHSLQLFFEPKICAAINPCTNYTVLQEADDLTQKTDYQKQIEKYDWSWDDQKVGPLNCAYRATGDLQFGITTLPKTKHRLDIAVLSDGRRVFSWRGHHASVFCVATDRLYFADWSIGASGGNVVAVDLVSGQEIWRKPLKALGDIEHSTYQTLFNIDVSENVVIVWGNESQGKYVEFKSAQTGETIAQKIFPKDEIGVNPPTPTDARTKR